MSTENKMLSVTEAASQLDLSDRRVRKFCEEGRIGQRVGNRWVILSSDIDKIRRELEANVRSPMGKEAAQPH